MSSQIGTTLAVLTSMLQSTGLFASADTVEPKAPPSNSLVAAIWLSGVKPVGQISGLGKGTVLYEFTLRIYSNLLQTPADKIDPQLVVVVDQVFDALCGDFDLGSTVRNIDILGEVGAGLTARAGHVEVGGTMFRAIDITVPIIVNDVIDFTP